MLVHDQLRTGEGDLSRRIDQPSNVIGMRMGQKNRINVARLHPSKCKVRFQLASPLFESSRTRINQDRAATTSDQVAIDVNRRWTVHACVLLQL